jgi:hypothetical protein
MMSAIMRRLPCRNIVHGEASGNIEHYFIPALAIVGQSVRFGKCQHGTLFENSASPAIPGKNSLLQMPQARANPLILLGQYLASIIPR